MLETVSRGKKPQIHKVDFVFQSYRWYMITICYVHNRVRNSQLSCYINATPLLQTEVILPATDDVRIFKIESEILFKQVLLFTDTKQRVRSSILTASRVAMRVSLL